MKYVVAKGCSFVGDKKTYNESDEIDETAFSKKERFEKFTKGPNPKIVPAPSVGEKGEKEEDLTGVDLTGVDLTGVDLTGVDLTGVDLTGITAPTRENIEKLILEKGLLKEEKMKKFSDENLLKFAVKKGLVKK